MALEKAEREEAIRKAIKAYEESAGKEAITLPYRDAKAGPFEVITVAVDAVVFNPKSHRVKAQLESDAKRAVVEADPFGEEAQAAIQRMLSETEGFEELRANLEEYPQNEPGVVTRDGLMVNANTRLAAQRAIGPDSMIRAAVLPSDADERSIDLLELVLQMQRDFKQEYTYPNELWFIEDLFVYGYSAEEIATRLQWAPSNDERKLKKGIARVEQSVRVWATIRAIQERNKAIKLTFFDDKKQILVDLDAKYEKVKGSDPDGAELMKEVRIAGLLAECDYRDLRKLDADTAIDVLIPQLEESEVLGTEIEQLTQAGEAAEPGEEDDTELLAGGEEDPAASISFEPLVELLAGSHDEKQVELPSGEMRSRNAVLGDFAEAVQTSAERIRARDKGERTIRGPIKALEEALSQARAAESRYENVGHQEGFDSGKFGYLMKKLRGQLEAIEAAVKENEAQAGR